MALTEKELSIPLDDRVAIIGQTGSGKSYFGKVLLHGAQRLVVCDVKGTIAKEEDWNLEEYTPRLFRKLQQGKPARIRIPPRSPDEWDDFFRSCLSLRNCVIFVDELYEVGPAQGSEGLRALYTQGRALGLSIWGCSQRPAWIPRFAMSEAGYIVLFRLTLEEDRDRMYSMIGPGGNIPLKNHGLVFYNVHTGNWQRFSELSIKGK